MSGTPALDHLARLAGIEDGWWDFFGEWRVVPAETKRVFLAAMGLPAATEDECRDSLRDFEARSWRTWLEPVQIVEENSAAFSGIAVTLPHELDHSEFEWKMEEELGIIHSGRFLPRELRWGEEREEGGVMLLRRWLDLPALPPCGYHRFSLTAPDGATAAMTFIVTPSRAFVPDILEQPPGAWGVAGQIYALRSAADWGVGTYGNLAQLVEGAASLGAACVGINPVHALFPAQPDRFSPYSPSSRRYLNTAYLDIEALPEFAGCREAQRMFASPGFQAGLGRLRDARLIEYADAAQLARPMIEIVYRHFRSEHLAQGTERGRAFREFQRAGGEGLRRFATFEALHERFTREGLSYWRLWPEDLRRPDSPAVETFAAEHVERIEFFQWLQFAADAQLADAQARGKAAGGAIGPDETLIFEVELLKVR